MTTPEIPSPPGADAARIEDLMTKIQAFGLACYQRESGELQKDMQTEIRADLGRLVQPSDGPWTVNVAGPDDVHRFDTELDALRFANQVNRTYLADLLAHPGDEVLCLATVADASLPLAPPAEAEPISAQYLREQIARQMKNVREALAAPSPAGIKTHPWGEVDDSGPSDPFSNTEFGDDALQSPAEGDLIDLIHALDVASYRAGSAKQYHEQEDESPGVTQRALERAERVRQESLAAVLRAVNVQPKGTPVAWLRDQRGEFEGPQTLDPMLILGATRPAPGMHGATYSPVYDEPASSPAPVEWIGTPLAERLENLMHAALWDKDEVPFLKANLIRDIERCFAVQAPAVTHEKKELQPPGLIVRALELASRIADRVPTRVHLAESADEAFRDIGRMVNAQDDGSHGYRLINDALEAAKDCDHALLAIMERAGEGATVADVLDRLAAVGAEPETAPKSVARVKVTEAGWAQLWVYGTLVRGEYGRGGFDILAALASEINSDAGSERPARSSDAKP
ncbi:MAG TPA: hypothetical protein VIN03_11875 [Roseateles sp.]